MKIIDPTPYTKKDWYRGSEGLKRHGVKTSYTKEMIAELKRCYDDIEYFAAKYVNIIDIDKGSVKFKARDYQKKFWKIINENRFIISKQGRQAGKTTAIVGYLLWYSIFHGKRTVGVCAQNVSQAKEIIHRFKSSYELLPSWLQVGVVEWQKGSVSLGNGTRIFASSSNGDALRGKSLSLLILDEFAHIRNDKEFMTATWPVVSSGKKSKIIIISTPNGMANAFYDLWKGALDKINEFVTYAVEWNEIPGRDDEWRKNKEAEVGKQRFAQEYAAEFIGSSNTLVDGHKIETMIAACEHKQYKTTSDSHIKIFEEPIEGHQYILTSDVARGYGEDYSTFSIFDVSVKPYKQVCTFADNFTSTKVLPYLIAKYARKYNEAFVVVEANESGGEVNNTLWYDIEYENTFTKREGGKFRIGLYTTKHVKRSGCSNLRDLLDGNVVEVMDAETAKEFRNFESNKSGVYNAKQGYYDDRVQNLWLLAYALETKQAQYFKEDIEGVKQTAHKKIIEDLIEDLPPVGIMNGRGVGHRSGRALMNRVKSSLLN